MGLFSKKKRPGFAAKQAGKWYQEEHVWGKDTFRCSICGSIYSHSANTCPFCHAKMKKTVTDPVWVDEMSMMDGY